jgi:simple sugar transport system ATP-binding protein
MMSEYLVQTENLHKFFGAVHALRGVSFNVGHNEVVGLVGDNGAGKSTLIKILTGVYPWDNGEIYIKGQKINKKGYSVQKARELGIETVYQEKALAEKQCLWRNFFMGREIANPLGFLRIADMKNETEKVMTKYIGFTSSAVTPDSIVKKFSGGEKQGVAIARGLFFEADLIILDEPTMALSVSEVKKVLDFVRKIRGEKKSCIFITHNIYNVYPVADRFVILDRGKIVTELEKEGTSLEGLVDEMVHAVMKGEIKA